jgi:hypothetical protein
MMAALAVAQSAAALTMQQCGAKYKAAQTAGTLNGMTWQQFRKANCGPGASPLAASQSGTGSAPGAAFPQAISPKYANEPGKARVHTCLDQCRSNKASSGNAGCLKRLSARTPPCLSEGRQRFAMTRRGAGDTVGENFHCVTRGHRPHAVTVS